MNHHSLVMDNLIVQFAHHVCKVFKKKKPLAHLYLVYKSFWWISSSITVLCYIDMKWLINMPALEQIFDEFFCRLCAVETLVAWIMHAVPLLANEWTPCSQPSMLSLTPLPLPVEIQGCADRCVRLKFKREKSRHRVCDTHEWVSFDQRSDAGSNWSEKNEN